MYRQNIHIALATAEPDVANRLLKSMKSKLPSFRIQASILLFGSTNPPKFYKFCIPVDIIDIVRFYPPIVDTRNICQRHLQGKMEQEEGIGFILDDDLRWTMDEHIFITLIDQLRANRCDMAFSSLSGDSPIPKEYTRTSPLLDVLIAISEIDPTDLEIQQYIDNIDISHSSSVESNAHHDFYSFNQYNFCRHSVDISSIRWFEFIELLVKGKSTTRQVMMPKMITLANGRERGGATIIFNSTVLSFKNDAMRSEGLISRRSDMIMGTDASHSNFKLFNTPPMLEHCRDESFDTHGSKKLIGDILGYALVESRNGEGFCKNKFTENLAQRIDQTKILLRQSSVMLKLLERWLNNHGHIGIEESKLLESMISENELTISSLISLDFQAILESFNSFARLRAKSDGLCEVI